MSTSAGQRPPARVLWHPETGRWVVQVVRLHPQPGGCPPGRTWVTVCGYHTPAAAPAAPSTRTGRTARDRHLARPPRRRQPLVGGPHYGGGTGLTSQVKSADRR